MPGLSKSKHRFPYSTLSHRPAMGFFIAIRQGAVQQAHGGGRRLTSLVPGETRSCPSFPRTVVSEKNWSVVKWGHCRWRSSKAALGSSEPLAIAIAGAFVGSGSNCWGGGGGGGGGGEDVDGGIIRRGNDGGDGDDGAPASSAAAAAARRLPNTKGWWLEDRGLRIEKQAGGCASETRKSCERHGKTHISTANERIPKQKQCKIAISFQMCYHVKMRFI
ncbi:hypothetical protein VaNZ11_012849 [Volvox africanus]|uniref:Uncharacterized protein n=1 Tax=Volvox africanus TaxID=51714 RepID=A0ABQ5SGB7_9CHLO|nr:hypothetical protein VaNZ11_012849 [Volvox africanus]